MSSFCKPFSKLKKTIFIALMCLFLNPIIALADGFADPPPPDEPEGTTSSPDSTQDEMMFVEVLTILLITIL